MFNRRSASTYHVLASLTGLAGFALFGSILARDTDWADAPRWEAFCHMLFGEMGSTGIYFVFLIAFLTGFIAIWVLDLPRRCGRGGYVLLVTQYGWAAVSLALVM